MEWLNYHHLYYFKTIVEHESMANASKALRLGQPALSMQLKQLEHQLQHPLFEREGKRLVLTEIGKMTYEYAKEIFTLGRELQDSLRDISHGKTKVQIGVQDCIPRVVTTQLTGYLYQNDNVQITISIGNYQELVKDLVEHKVDLLLLNAVPQKREKEIFFSKRVLKSHIVFAGSKKYSSLKSHFPKCLDRAPLIVPSTNSQLRHSLEHFFNKKKWHLNIVGEVENTSLQKDLAIHGHGLIPIIPLAIKQHVIDKELFVLGEVAEMGEEIWMVSLKRKRLNKLAEQALNDFELTH